MGVRGLPADEHAAMSFKEIGERLGITQQCAAQYYRSGLRKLRKLHFEEMWQLLMLSEEKKRIIKRYDWPADPWADDQVSL